MSVNDKNAGHHDDRVADTPQVRTEGSVLEDVHSVSDEKRLDIIATAEGKGKDVPQGFKSADGSDATVVKSVDTKVSEKIEQRGTVQVTKGMNVGVDSMAAVHVRVRETEETTTTGASGGGAEGLALGARAGVDAMSGRAGGREGAREGGKEGEEDREGASEAADERSEEDQTADAAAGEAADEAEQAAEGAEAGDVAGGASDAGAKAGKDAAEAGGKAGMIDNPHVQNNASDSTPTEIRKRK